MGAPKVHGVKYPHVGRAQTVKVSQVYEEDIVGAAFYPACAQYNHSVPTQHRPLMPVDLLPHLLCPAAD